jgi:amino-acid N-acetyltransferase
MNIFPRPGAIRVMNLLAACSLPNSDISEAKLRHFFGCGSERNPGGVVGVELYGDVALLRSLAVDETARGKGCGKRLVREVEDHAARSGVKRLYLLTTTAEKYFQSLGYARVDRESVPAPIQGTTEFSSLCSASATVMTKDLSNA